MSKILITGIAGFIGSHLAEELIKKGHKVTGLDNLSTGRKKNISGLGDCSFIEGSVQDEGLLNKLVPQCDIIYHLAASVGVRLITERPVDSIETNILGTVKILRAADKYKKKIFLASSSEVYGKLDKKVLKENDMLCLGPPDIVRWAYGCTKLLSEYLGLSYYRKKGLPVVIGRFFNICGPRQIGSYGMVMPRFIKAALSGEPITVYGDGTQTRSFMYITDAIGAVIGLTQEDKFFGKVFNIGNPEKVNIKQLAEQVKSITSSGSSILYTPYNEIYGDNFEDMHYRVPDISKIKEAIGFMPQIPLKEIIVKTMDYWKGCS